MENEEMKKMMEITENINLPSDNLPALRNNGNDKNYIRAATSENTRKAYPPRAGKSA